MSVFNLEEIGGFLLVADPDIPEGAMHVNPRDYQNAIGCRRPNAADGKMCAMVRASRKITLGMKELMR